MLNKNLVWIGIALFLVGLVSGAACTLEPTDLLGQILLNDTPSGATDDSNHVFRTISNTGTVNKNLSTMGIFENSVYYAGTGNNDYSLLNQSIILDGASDWCFQWCGKDLQSDDVYEGLIMGNHISSNPFMGWNRPSVGMGVRDDSGGVERWGTTSYKQWKCYTVTHPASGGLYFFENTTSAGVTTWGTADMTMDSIAANSNINLDFEGNLVVIEIWNKNCSATDISNFYNSGNGNCVNYGGAADPCDYSGSGNYNLNLADNCTISSNVSVQAGYNVTVYKDPPSASKSYLLLDAWVELTEGLLNMKGFSNFTDFVICRNGCFFKR